MAIKTPAAKVVKTKFISPGEAAALLECDRRSILRMVSRGDLVGKKIGGRYKIHRESFEAVLKAAGVAA